MDDDIDPAFRMRTSALGVAVRDQALSICETGFERAAVALPFDTSPITNFGGRSACVALYGGSIDGVTASADGSGRPVVRDGAATARLHIYFMVAGEATFELGGQTRVVQARDVVLCRRRLSVSKNRQEHRGHGSILILRRDAQFPPLATSLAYLANHHANLSPDEVADLVSACRSLLPLAIASSVRTETAAGHSQILAALLAFVERHISDSGLSPHAAARNLGISVRYVHKLFATLKTTFGSYVGARRLELMREAMLSPLHRDQRISMLAQQCGFIALSTFNRAFKRRYGVTPRAFRNAAGGAGDRRALGRDPGEALRAMTHHAGLAL
jgi:AraC-like DNA-binding protein